MSAHATYIRQSFLDFFASKGHTIVPSASLMPSSPNLLFTNAGMNPLVPYFLGEQIAPYNRIANTQKCIRAGGKHNDLEDVGFDTYHHTFFEMLGNWSIGDYFKKEAIEWAWELLTQVWKFPKERLYATVYKPADGDPASFDEEAYELWSTIFKREGMDPSVHICFGNRKDNFWMMGDTGPCGPCSEVHIDLSPKGDTQGKLVNAGSPECMEIWNLVFIQFNALGEGAFEPLAAKHVDTGMGLERVAGILATTEQFTNFSKTPSNYNSDLFAGVFEKVTEQSGCSYKASVPSSREHMSKQEMVDCSFRVLADHIRTLSFSIADGIYPGNEGRNYVLRRILRRAVLFGKRLQLPDGFFSELVEPLAIEMRKAFPELEAHKAVVKKTLQNEERAFERVLDRGLQLFEKVARKAEGGVLQGEVVFTLYDTYGFPLDLTELLARERDLTLDTAGFERCMEEQRTQARGAQQKVKIKTADQNNTLRTEFIGYSADFLVNIPAKVLQVLEAPTGSYIITDQTPFYAEMGGQLGDTGEMIINGALLPVLNTFKDETGKVLHQVDASKIKDVVQGTDVLLTVDLKRRFAIQRHHTATHLLNWALCEVLGQHVRQAGSFVSDAYLRFDFAHYEALSNQQLTAIERLINEHILENAAVSIYEVPFAQKPENCKAFFGEKYGEVVRVVDIGGYSIELCGGTHAQSAGELGLFQICSESNLAAGVRRIEAVVGLAAYAYVESIRNSMVKATKRLSCNLENFGSRLDQLWAQKEALEASLSQMRNKEINYQVNELAAKAFVIDDISFIIETIPITAANELRTIALQLSARINPSVILIVGVIGDKVHIASMCSEKAIALGHKAGMYLRDLNALLGGKGGGKDDFATGGAAYQSNFQSIFNQFKENQKNNKHC
jgi:alanyl-tRNA synthetase